MARPAAEYPLKRSQLYKMAENKETGFSGIPANCDVEQAKTGSNLIGPIQ